MDPAPYGSPAVDTAIGVGAVVAAVAFVVLALLLFVINADMRKAEAVIRERQEELVHALLPEALARDGPRARPRGVEQREQVQVIRHEAVRGYLKGLLA